MRSRCSSSTKICKGRGPEQRGYRGRKHPWQLAILSQLAARSSQLAALIALGTGLGEALRAQSQPPFFTEFSTHDATTTAVHTPSGLSEKWADAKSTGALMPGRGWTFVVGTVQVTTTLVVDDPKFSEVDILLPPSPVDQAGFRTGSGLNNLSKQVVVLQARGPDQQASNAANQDQTIRWQRFFYGESGLNLWEFAPVGRPATNARAVSVWPVLDGEGELDEIETRIAICGESFECTLPRSQFADGNSGRMKFWGGPRFAANYPRGLPSGFIAVYRGNGELLWTHQFCYLDAGFPVPGVAQLGGPEGSCAITDVSIRVEEVDGVMRDVVTYCGISSFGVRDPAVETGSLTPLRAFDVSSTPNILDGAVNNGLGQWDGIVGRISNLHDVNPVSGTATVREFHSVVASSEQDGLWGIAEMPDDRFVVVGSTATMSASLVPQPATTAPVTPTAFPFTNGGPPGIGTGVWPVVDHCVGTMLVFDASQTRNITTPNALILESAVSLGRAGWRDEWTVAAAVARDVHVAFDSFNTGGATLHRIAVVGSSNDSDLFSSVIAPQVPVTAFGGGGSDGFLITAIDRLGSNPVPPWPVFVAGTFQGDAGSGGWCGVGSWSEYRDHVSVLGWIQEPGQNNKDLEFTSFVIDTATVPSDALLEIRRGSVATPADEVPAAMGEILAINPPVPAVGPWVSYGLQSPAGGGITMDERGRLNVVGSTDPGGLPSSGFPFVGGLLARDWLSGIDAVRMVPTMLPVTVGRTDRSGAQTHFLGSIPPAPTGRTGSTTPTCALLPFGPRLDGTLPLPVGRLRRMLIDWQGPEPMPTPTVIVNGIPAQPPIHFLLVDRPPASWQWTGTVVQFGVPTAPPVVPNPLPSGIENWVPSGVTTYLLLPAGELSVRIPLVLPPSPGGGLTFSAQVVTASLTPFSCTNDIFAATPAIVFSY